MVVRGCCHCCRHSHVLFFPLCPPVTADLLGWSSATWRYTKSHYSVGHGLDKEERNTGWGRIKEGPHSPHTNRLTRRQRDGGGRAEDLILGEKAVVWGVWWCGSHIIQMVCLNLAFVCRQYMFTSQLLRKHTLKCSGLCSCVCVWTYVMCLCACTHAQTYLSSSFSSVHHRARRRRERARVTHPADERVKVKALPSQKNITRLPCSLFEVIQEEGGKRHTFSIALKHGVRQLPSCCTL